MNDRRSLIRNSARREIVRRLNDEDLEHHDRIEWRTPASRAIGISKRRVQFWTENLEIQYHPECLELIANIAQPPQAIIDIKKSSLSPHRIISEPSVQMESEMR